jgi:hypothetical protein
LRYPPLIRRRELREVTQLTGDFVDEQGLAVAFDMQEKRMRTVAQQGDAMARVIQFHIPAGFEPKTDQTASEDWGKLIDFPYGPAMESWREIVAELKLWADWR